MEAEKRSKLCMGRLPGRQTFQAGIALLVAVSALCIVVCGCANPRAAGIHLNAGIGYIGSKQYALAMKELMEAERLHSSDPEVHYYLGVVYHVRGLTKEAITELKRAISLKNDYANAHNYLGLIYDGNGQYDDAIASFKKAATNVLYDTPSYAWNNLGWSYYKKGDYDSAANAFTEAARLDLNAINRAAFETNAGRALLAKGDPDRAVAYFTHALKIMPEAADTYYWLGKAQQQLRRPEEALKAFRTAVEKSPNTDLQVKVKEAIDQLNKEAQAQREKELAMKPPVPPVVAGDAPQTPTVIKKKKKEPAPEPPVKKKKRKTKKTSGGMG